MYATIEGFELFLGDSAGEFLAMHPDAETQLADCEARLLAYITPNAPCCDEQRSAFSNAVYAQVVHENSSQNAQLASMPSGMTGFTVNGFSAQFAAGAGNSVFAAGLSKRARAELMLSGLLYRGVCLC